MAMFPCLVGSHRYAGAQSSLYGTLAHEGRTEGRKARLCPEHMLQFVHVLDEHLHAIDDQVGASGTCEHCDAPASEIFFATAYSPRNKELGWVADLCGAHTARCLAALGWGDWVSR